MSIKFPPAILGPGMAAPILCAPGIFWFFLLENPHAHKIPPFWGEGGFWAFLEEGGGGSANFIRMWLFCLQLEASCLQWRFFYLQLTILAFLLTIEAFLLTILASLLTVGAFLLTMGKCI